MTEARTPLEPGPDHPIRIEPYGRRVTISVGDFTVVETDRGLRLREADYPSALCVPLDDLNRSLLRESTLRTYCPYKGDARYYDIVPPGQQSVQAAIWYYPHPYPAVAQIEGHVAFYGDRVTITKGLRL